MDLRTQNEKAAAFRRLHDDPRVLVLPNAWDAASARVFEEAGFAAVGTTSAGIAWSLGYPDGEKLDRNEMVEAIHRIAQAVAVPVTADIEAGFGATPDEVARTVEAVISAGAVGMNLEDGTSDPDQPLRDRSEQVERIRAAREAASSMGVEIVLNARTDVFWLSVGDEDERLRHAVPRANAYREAAALSAEIVEVGEDREERRLKAEELASEEGLAPVSPYDDGLVMDGQGTPGFMALPHCWDSYPPCPHGQGTGYGEG